MKRAECPLIIDKNNLRTLNIDDHIQFMITVHVHKCECHRNEITATRIKLRSKKNARMSSIPAGKLNHLYSSVEIYSNKVTGHACSFVMTHKLIRLKCPRTAIADVLHRSTEPVRGSHSHCPQDQHTQHSQTKIEQWMSTSFHCLLALDKLCVPVGFCGRVLGPAGALVRRTEGCPCVFVEALSASRCHSSISTWVSVERVRDVR